MERRKVICVVGPTACGKTTLGVLLAKKYGGEVVSADSMQIYRGMTIGTAAPTEAEMQGVPHHMIAVADPAEQWSAAEYVQRATPVEVTEADKVIVMNKGEIVMEGKPKEIFAEVETLQKYHLDVPQVTLLAHELKKRGMTIPVGITSADELVDVIAKQLGK